MFALVGRVVRKVVELATRRMLREAIASAIVTIVVTAAFTGFASHSEPPVPATIVVARAAAPVPPEPRSVAAAPAPGPATVDYAKVWFDPNAVTPHPTGFRRTVSAAAEPAPAPRSQTHKRVGAARQGQAPARPIVQASAHVDDKALGHGHAPDALATPAPEQSRFRVWGVAPSDLIPSVPSASSIIRGVKSVGTSVAGMMPSL